MTEVLKMQFGKLEVYKNYMVVMVDEGETIDFSKLQQLIKISEKVFKGRPFVYITHRINSYAVDPQVYEPTAQIPNLVGFCVVSSNFMAKSNASIEKMFFKKPFEVFSTMEEAVQWTENLLEVN